MNIQLNSQTLHQTYNALVLLCGCNSSKAHVFSFALHSLIVCVIILICFCLYISLELFVMHAMSAIEVNDVFDELSAENARLIADKKVLLSSVARLKRQLESERQAKERLVFELSSARNDLCVERNHSKEVMDVSLIAANVIDFQTALLSYYRSEENKDSAKDPNKKMLEVKAEDWTKKYLETKDVMSRPLKRSCDEIIAEAIGGKHCWR